LWRVAAFLKEMVHKEPEGHVCQNIFAADRDRWDIWEPAANNRKRFESGHSGHSQAGKNYVWENLSEYFERYKSILGSANRKPKTANDSSGSLKDQRVVVHYQYSASEKTTLLHKNTTLVSYATRRPYSHPWWLPELVYIV
jgi:hypothetical protein